MAIIAAVIIGAVLMLAGLVIGFMMGHVSNEKPEAEEETSLNDLMAPNELHDPMYGIVHNSRVN